MAIKKTINGATPKLTTQIKAPNLNKTVVGIKKDEQTIVPDEVEETSALTDLTESELDEIKDNIKYPENKYPEKDGSNIITDEFGMPLVTDGLLVGEANSQKNNQEKKFAKIALFIGIGFLVLMILNKK